MRYTELNPVRAGMVPKPELFRWSSAAVHCGHNAGTLPLHLDTASMNETWNANTWCEFLGSGPADLDAATLRAYTHTGRPLGSAEFVHSLENTLHRSLTAQKGGRPRKPQPESAQPAFHF